MKLEGTYDKQYVNELLSDLKINQYENIIKTTFRDRLVSRSEVTDKYQMFDFPNFAKSIIPEAENYFTPDKFKLKITKGTQELRLVGESQIINNEQYFKMLNIVSSSDKSKSLQLNIGLIRFICSNGMVIAVEHNSIKTKHLKSTLDSKINSFYENLQNFNQVINNQKEILNTLQDKTVSFIEISKELLKGKEDETTLPESRMLKLKAFSKKLLTSETDKLENLTVGQIEILNNPSLVLKNILTDIEIPAHKAFNNYIEVYRSFDSTVLQRETNRILSIIN